MQTVLEVKQVTKQYGQQYALDHVSLSIREGRNLRFNRQERSWQNHSSQDH